MYEVIETFIEKEHDDTLYKKGDTYPKEGHKAVAKRVKLLQGDKNKYKRPFLGEEIKKKSDEK